VGKAQIGIAMSGGVDSTACALKLRDSHQVHGFFMQLAQADLAQQLSRVKDIARRCEIPLTVIDLRQRFAEKVLSYFADTYGAGRTPNPCMICNREIKFGLFMDAILERGLEAMATGHYANIREHNGLFFLEQGTDHKKDQSYFLARLNQYQLARIRFPLGKMTKDDVYSFVESRGFMDFRGRESQDVCFLGDQSVGQFLGTLDTSLPESGDIVHSNGEILGRHNGIQNYTIGQRRGLGIAAAAPLYVIRIDASTNQVIVAGNDALFQKEITVANTQWNAAQPPASGYDYQVRIRYGQQPQEARISIKKKQCYNITFKEPQRAMTPGQFAVVYDGGRLMGSGEIQ
jgi:tRNA-specific 2-thiouridylase